MSYNRSIMKNTLDEINIDSFKEAIFLCYKDGITSVAPLGISGDTILLHATNGESRRSEVSIRNYCGDAELLITDAKGNFIFYGRFHCSVGVESLAFEYFRIFTKVKDRIIGELPNRPNFSNCNISESATISQGFEMLQAYQEKYSTPFFNP